jgi:hypothetical protein
MTERDSKNIIRQWDREIDAELRRAAAREKSEAPWRAVGWAALWLLWLALLAAVVARLRAIG